MDPCAFGCAVDGDGAIGLGFDEGDADEEVLVDDGGAGFGLDAFDFVGVYFVFADDSGFAGLEGGDEYFGEVLGDHAFHFFEEAWDDLVVEGEHGGGEDDAREERGEEEAFVADARGVDGGDLIF